MSTLEAVSSPLADSLFVAVSWLVIAALALVPAHNAFFARQPAFPLGALAGLALAAFGLQTAWLPAQSLTLPLGLPDLPFHLRIDPLAVPGCPPTPLAIMQGILTAISK